MAVGVSSDVAFVRRRTELLKWISFFFKKKGIIHYYLGEENDILENFPTSDETVKAMM